MPYMNFLVAVGIHENQQHPQVRRRHCCLRVLCWLLQVFEQGQMRGYWKLSYCDPNFRVFYTNKGNLFVLRRTGTA
jgi:hypothetical protein